MSGSVKSQILVKDQFSNLHKISIDLFSNGENLLQVLATELGEELEKNCNVTFRTKKVKKYNFSKYCPFKRLYVPVRLSSVLVLSKRCDNTIKIFN